jgi:MFS family permease
MFFFQERTRKINLWAFIYLVGPYPGPFIAGFLIQNINWRQDFGVLVAFYSFSTLMIICFGDETLYDRKISERTAKPEGVLGSIKLLIGVAGLGAGGRPTISTVIKDLIATSYLPYLIVPCEYAFQTRRMILTLKKLHLPCTVYVGNRDSNLSHLIR